MRILLALALWLSSISCASAACPPAGQDRDSLQALRAAQFAMPDAAARRISAFTAGVKVAEKRGGVWGKSLIVCLSMPQRCRC